VNESEINLQAGMTAGGAALVTTLLAQGKAKGVNKWQSGNFLLIWFHHVLLQI
jgi:hypothetical protein